MNKKIINYRLKSVHAKFVASIEDKAVRDTVDKKAIITGGSIASLLLNEPVNDYDYYFTDKEAAKAVAEYFVKKFIEQHPEVSIKPYVRAEEDRVKVIIKSAGLTSENEGKGPEYQYFESRPDEEAEAYVTENLTDADEVSADTLEEKQPYRPVYITQNAITLSNKIQLILRFFGDADAIHENYDFVHCTNYWTSENRELTLRQVALESILARQLLYNGSCYPVCSIIRTRKFIKRGWHINAGQFLKMCFQVSELDLHNIEVLEDQLIGVDSAYFRQVIEYCKERQQKDDGFKITTPYLVSIIDKIF